MLLPLGILLAVSRWTAVLSANLFSSFCLAAMIVTDASSGSGSGSGSGFRPELELELSLGLSLSLEVGEEAIS